MILSIDIQEKPKGGKGKKAAPPAVPGERSKASTFFNNLPLATQATCLQSTFEITRQGAGRGSGVILYTDATYAYVLTATHILYLFGGDTKPKKTPREYAEAGALSNATIGYDPPSLLKPPATKTSPGGVEVDWDYTADSWDEDVMVLKVTDATFRAFVSANRFLKQTDVKEYNDKLLPGKTGPEILDVRQYLFIQLGYGASSDPTIPETSQYKPPYAGQVQCVRSEPKNRAVISEAFSIGSDADSKKWPILKELCMLTANNTKSTGSGDSGGPMFALDNITKSQIYLVGITSGANYFTDSEYKKNPAKAPKDNAMHNNVASYWYGVFQLLQSSIP